MLQPEEAQEKRTDFPCKNKTAGGGQGVEQKNHEGLSPKFKSSNPGSSTHERNDLGRVNDLTSLTLNFLTAQTHH